MLELLILEACHRPSRRIALPCTDACVLYGMCFAKTRHECSVHIGVILRTA